MIGLATATEVTGVIAIFFLLLALMTVLRLVLRKEEPIWRALRVGFFVERLPERNWDEEHERLPPTTYMPPDRRQL